MAAYAYFNETEVLVESFNKALQLIKQEKITVDVGHLKLIEAAENDDFKAICELSKAFGEGNLNGIPRNYSMARFYTDKIIRFDKQSKCPKVICNAYRNSGLIERNFGNVHNAAKEFIKAIKIMCNEIDAHEWDHDIPHYLWEVTAGRKQGTI